MTRGYASWRDYAGEVARLDALSRTRALTDAESLLLERYLSRLGNKPKRAPVGNTKELARHGMKRRHADMKPQRVWCEQCCRTVALKTAAQCRSRFCKAKVAVPQSQRRGTAHSEGASK